MYKITKMSTRRLKIKNAPGEPYTEATIIYQSSINYQPKVSVIIPVYNTEKYLRECLESVVNQTLVEIEIICVDDGSTDSSLDILKEYAQKDDRFTIITQNNSSAGVARNAGLAVAKGEYVLFLDSDDLFELNMFDEMYLKAKELSLDIVVCKSSKFYDNTKKDLNVFGIEQQYIPQKEVFSIEDLKSNWAKAFIPAVWNKLYNLNFIKKHKLYFQNLKSCNDIGFSLCVTAVAKRISIVPKVFVHYRKGGEICISSTRGKHAYNIILAYDYIKNFLIQHNRQDFINSLNEAIKNNILYEASNCNLIQLISFRIKSKKYFAKDWYKFKNSFTKNIYQRIFSVRNNIDKTHKVISLLGLKIKFKRKVKRKNYNKSYKSFIYHNIRQNSVLLVELNKFHGECLPGIAKYFIDLGYNVDVLMNNDEYKLNPFADFNDNKVSLYSADTGSIKDILCSDIIEKYEHLYLNSDRIYGNSISEYLGCNIKYPTGKIITMCHHAENYNEINFNTDNMGILALIDLPILKDKKYKSVNPHYFKDIVSHSKNKITTFVAIGNISSSRKNHSLLLDAVQELVTNNIINFKIVVIARIGEIEIPEQIKNYFEFKSNLPYGEMYRELESADFLLTLLDPENIEHDRYLDCGASGSYQLMYGFNIPGLIPHKFQSEINGFNNSNSVGYNGNKDFSRALKMAIEMSNEEYLTYTKNLENTAKEIYNKSLNNLKELLHIEYKYPVNTFISLGINCFNRVVLTRHHLKRHKKDGELSCPFDLCVCPLNSIIKCIENEFNGYFDDLQWDNNQNIWTNPSLEINYNHDLDCPSTDSGKLINRYTQRIENFKELLLNNNKKYFLVSIINPQENEHDQINKLYELLKSKCKSEFQLVIIVIAKEIKFAENKLNKNILFKHIPHPYQYFFGEWFKGEYFNSPEGKMFEKEYINFVDNCTRNELPNV